VQPFYDTKAGELDTWPAYASRRVEGSQSVALSRDKKLVLLNNSSKGVEACAPKPKFLDDLQRYLQEELRALGVLNDGPSELRLQASVMKSILSASAHNIYLFNSPVFVLSS
jgi:hypothetical protein